MIKKIILNFLSYFLISFFLIQKTIAVESELYKKVKIESVQHLSAKEIPFDIFKSMMEDKDISQLEKNYLEILIFF